MILKNEIELSDWLVIPSERKRDVVSITSADMKLTQVKQILFLV